MDTLRLSEHFVSPQGEGPRTGVMTQFVRFAGCNMKCPGWPCDTQYAIDPAIWRHDSYKRTPRELFEDCWDKVVETDARMINLTGGEPFMQNNELLQHFIEFFDGTFTIECFSNGSFPYPEWAIDRVRFVMDWKLTGSGEATTCVDVRMQNALRLRHDDAIKFVVAHTGDLLEAIQVWRLLRDRIPVQFWVGAAWGLITPAEIVEFVKEHRLPWRLNVQVHNYIYEPQERGR